MSVTNPTYEQLVETVELLKLYLIDREIDVGFSEGLWVADYLHNPHLIKTAFSHATICKAAIWADSKEEYDIYRGCVDKLDYHNACDGYAGGFMNDDGSIDFVEFEIAIGELRSWMTTEDYEGVGLDDYFTLMRGIFPTDE